MLGGVVGEKQLDSSVFESGASRDCPLWVGFERMGGGDRVQGLSTGKTLGDRKWKFCDIHWFVQSLEISG